MAGAFHTDATGTSFADALTKADAVLVANSTEHVAIVQVGSDVIVFIDNGTDHVADDAIILTGKALADITGRQHHLTRGHIIDVRGPLFGAALCICA